MENYLKFNNAEAIQYADVVQGNFLFTVVIPTYPDLGDVRKWGLYSANQQIGIYFYVTGDQLHAVVEDVTSGHQEAQEITINPLWIGAPVEYQIIWEAGMAKFLIDGVQQMAIAFNDNDMSFATQPLSIYIKNGNADDMFVGVIEAKDVLKYL